MKLFKKFTFSIALTALTIGLLTLLAPEAQADQQGLSQTTLSLTNLPATLATATVSSYTSNYVAVRTYSGLGMEVAFTGSNNMTGPVTCYMYPTTDGTNAATTALYAPAFTANGTNLVIGVTNWNNLQFKGLAGFFITVSNGTGNGINLNTSVTNGVNTNQVLQGGVNFNRPNQ